MLQLLNRVVSFLKQPTTDGEQCAESRIVGKLNPAQHSEESGNVAPTYGIEEKERRRDDSADRRV